LADETPLRADAQRNRDLILAAAEEVFKERGANASLDEVARRAKVGIGTLYRRFPSREALLAAAFSERFLGLAAASCECAHMLGPRDALAAYLEELVMHSSVYRGLAASLGTVLQTGSPGCHATTEEGHRLLRSAQEAGVVRQDVTFDDLLCAVAAATLAAEQGEPEGAAARAHHLVGLFLEGVVTR